MSELQTGTLTFVFTDIEGSTALWERNAATMAAARARHNQIIADAVAAFRGQYVREKGEGDSTFSVFPLAADAVGAICAIQCALAAESWPDDCAIRVRAAVHTGVGYADGVDYNSSDVNRCARLRAVGHGGQTLLSQSTRALVLGSLPDGVTLRELGEHRLKDLERPELVCQLLHPDLRSEFPPLNSLDAARTNLPIQLTSFIGRANEISVLIDLVRRHRLVTVLGAGGEGKTRLALQTAAELVATFANGVWLVDLSSISASSSDLCGQAVAVALGLREISGEPLLDTIANYLRARTLLLVLDNCEHLLEAARTFAEVALRACSNVRILATSRERLGVAGECGWRVPTLNCPTALPLEEKDLATNLMEFDACRLFVERARTHRPSFTLDRGGAVTVAKLCSALDGIPLAIELAAGRTRSLSVDQILRRHSRIINTADAAAGTPPRHRTMDAAITGTFEMLTREEQTLFELVSGFAGGWTLDAAEAICSINGVERDDVMALLSNLVDKSLVLVDERAGESWFRLLTVIREYALERLRNSDAEADVRKRHLNHYLNVAEEAEPQLVGSDQEACLSRLEREHDNLRAAFEFALETGEVETALRMTGSLSRLWVIHGYFSEGRERMSRALGRAGDAATPGRAKTLVGAEILARSQSDNDNARRLASEGLAAWRQLGNDQGISNALNCLGLLAAGRGEYEEARAFYYESLSLLRAFGDRRGIAVLLNNLGLVARDLSDHEAAESLFNESLTIHQALEDKQGIARAYINLGNVSYDRREFPLARTRFTLGLEISRELGYREAVSYSIYNLALTSWRMGEIEQAYAYCAQSVEMRLEMDDTDGIARSLETLAVWAAAAEKWVKAARISGTAALIRESIGTVLPPDYNTDYVKRMERVRDTLGWDMYEQASSQGRVTPLAQAITLALDSSAD